MQQQCDEPAENYRQPGSDRNQFEYGSGGEQSYDSRVGNVQSAEGFQSKPYSLETTRTPLPNSRYRVKETTRAPSPIGYDESYHSETSQNDQAYYNSQRRPEQSAISFNYEAARKPVNIIATYPENSGRLPGSYSDYSERPSQAQPTLNFFAVTRPADNFEADRRQQTIDNIHSETTRKPPQITNYQGYYESAKPSEKIDNQSYDYSKLPNPDRTRIVQNYQPQVYQSGNVPDDYQNDKPELSHIRDERPLLTPNQKIQIVIDYPTATYNSSNCKFKAIETV